MKMVTFYHDIEQDVNVEADGEACREAVQSLLALEASHDVRTTYNVWPCRGILGCRRLRPIQMPGRSGAAA